MSEHDFYKTFQQTPVSHRLRIVADFLTNDAFPGLGFALIVFPFDDGKGMRVGDYISNAERADMIAGLRGLADRLEKFQDMPPTLPGEH